MAEISVADPLSGAVIQKWGRDLFRLRNLCHGQGLLHNGEERQVLTEGDAHDK